MAYRIKESDDGVQAALRRIADEQLGAALEEIDDEGLDFAERIHRARKRCKKLRGLIRLVRPAFAAYGKENAALRDAARRLSDIRDARTLIQTYDAVAGHFDDRIDRRAFGPIRGRLTRDANRLADDPDTEARVGEFRRDVAAARDRAAGWTLDEDGFDAIAAGVGKTYARARKRLREARRDADGEAMHEWRKRVKYHWYQARLLREAFPEMVEPQADAADRLADLLGDHHDLVVLDARLAKAPGDFGGSTDVGAFRALVAERRDALAEEAFALGRPMLAEKPTALVARWRGYWKRGPLGGVG